ncbi:hypothetical protein, partial [uncultured Bartonella sp.]|uniref:hypothetical protein n=1 Tax=uncultured Bartonella sp. TaxID=104108 RepID=UPI0025CE73FE
PLLQESTPFFKIFSPFVHKIVSIQFKAVPANVFALKNRPKVVLVASGFALSLPQKSYKK